MASKQPGSLRPKWSTKPAGVGSNRPVGKPLIKRNGRPPALSRFQVEQLRLIIASLYLKGHTQAEIAEIASKALKVTIDRTRITKELKVVEADWRERAVLDMDEARSKELAKLDQLEATYWEGWARSLKPAVSTEQKEGFRPGPQGGPYEETKTSQSGIKGRPSGREGSPAFLDGVYKCIDRRIKLLGLDAPVKVDVTEVVREMAAEMGLNPKSVIDEVEQMLREHTTSTRSLPRNPSPSLPPSNGGPS